MSDRIDIGPQGFVYPMPMTLVGADPPTGPNFMPIAWINRVQFNHPFGRTFEPPNDGHGGAR